LSIERARLELNTWKIFYEENRVYWPWRNENVRKWE
jgi:hypothetical protein